MVSRKQKSRQIVTAAEDDKCGAGEKGTGIGVKLYGVIMAGGGGTRLWPLSRKSLPKQFLNITGRETMVNETFDRLAGVVPQEDIFVVTGQAYEKITRELMAGRVAKGHILTEPEARNTAACIGYAAMEILKKYGDGVMCIMPSDHYIRDEERFSKVLRRAAELAEAEDGLVTIGIKPTYPATGYGYICSSTVWEDGRRADYRRVAEFVEKPPLVMAEEYVSRGDFSWNSGMFIWKASVILHYFKRLLPDIYECLEKIGAAFGTAKEQEVLETVYPVIPKSSIDYGIMERAEHVLMLEGDFGWSDAGSLDALALVHESDGQGNICVGKNLVMDTNRTICYSSGRMIAAVGVSDLMIVETEDAVLVCPRERAQDVKKIVEDLEQKGYHQYL